MRTLRHTPELRALRHETRRAILTATTGETQVVHGIAELVATGHMTIPDARAVIARLRDRQRDRNTPKAA